MRLAHLLLAGVFLAFAITTFIQDQHHYATMASASGTVLRMVRLAKRSDPLVGFATPDGQQVQFLGDNPLLPLPRYQVGSRVTVLYEPAFPQRALIVNSMRWLFPLVGGAVGLYFLALAVWPSRTRD